MKKIVYTIIAILFYQSVQSQDYYAGPKIGAATMDYFTSSSNQIKPIFGGGFTAGGFFRVHNRYFFFQPELEYRFGSGNLIYPTTNNQGSNYTNIQSINYSMVSIPVLIGLKMPINKRNTTFFRAYGGGSVGVIFTGLNATSTNNTPPGTKIATTDDFGGKLGPFAWSWLVGAGLDIGSFMIDLKYDMIWNDIKPVNSSLNTSLRANTIVLSLSYKFKLDLVQGAHNHKK
jgi:hypothetical protein